MILLMLQPRWVSPLRTDQQRRCVLINFPFDGLEGRATKTSSTAPIVIIPIVKAERKKRRSTRRGGRGAHTCKECSHCSAVRVTFIIKLAPQLPMRAEQLRSYKLREEIACMSSRHCAAPVCFVCTRGQCSKPLELAVVRAVRRPSVRPRPLSIRCRGSAAAGQILLLRLWHEDRAYLECVSAPSSPSPHFTEFTDKFSSKGETKEITFIFRFSKAPSNKTE